MGETIERTLKNYKGYEICKVIENKGTCFEEITYLANDEKDLSLLDGKPTLKEIKNVIDIYIS